jgi:ABC-2 type transport system ATP-binding protein
VIQVTHVTRRFGEIVALDDVSLEAGRGEVVGILGVNGAGKSTLMRILTGALPATSGTAAVAGFDVLRQSLEVRARIGYLPESVPLYREHRVVEMLAFQARLHRIPRAEAKRRIPAVLERVGLADRPRELIGHLSRGLRQRVGLAVALLPEPEVLILDEPTSGLDPVQRLEVRKLVRELADQHTVLLSSHILPEIEAVCPRIVVLHRGRVAADGARDDLVRAHAGASPVRVEAVVGPDVESAARLLRAIAGVRSVRVAERLGIHQAFEVHGDGDLREDVGALAAARGWALRELSWRTPTLEQVFARIALGVAEEPPAAASAAASDRLVSIEVPARLESATPVAAPATAPPRAESAAPAPPTDAPKKAAYNLNPFERPRRDEAGGGTA